jgi:hypothetical protein
MGYIPDYIRWFYHKISLVNSLAFQYISHIAGKSYSVFRVIHKSRRGGVRT